MNPETAHHAATGALKILPKIPGGKTFLSSGLISRSRELEIQLGSLKFSNPVGLAAGFDKDALLINILPLMGFGFVEVGTVTPLAQPGQKRPRLFRIKEERALVNRLGFNNSGLAQVVERLKDRNRVGMSIPLGVNIGKGKETPLESAEQDYINAFEAVLPFADYVVLNVSSPNTPNLRDLQQRDYLNKILKAVQIRNSLGKQVFVKVSPDNDNSTLEEIVGVALDNKVGIVATNTTLDQAALGPQAGKESGGLSGRPLKAKSNETLSQIYKLTQGAVPLIGVGGIFSAEDAYEKIKRGASLIQVYTGWIYEGPYLVPAINRGLLKLLKKDGFRHIQEAVGSQAH